jgi:hypothetical protein
MVVPDLGLICEIMLMAEGFQMSKILSRKFVILYKLCEDLLSKSKHYDWKLRAIKTTLYVAGGMKRAAPELTEDKVRNSQGVMCNMCQQSTIVCAVCSQWWHPLLDKAGLSRRLAWRCATPPSAVCSMVACNTAAILDTASCAVICRLQVLLRALRDFNLGKLTSDDTSIFVGLLNDLFPKTLELVPRAVEKDFESKVGKAWCDTK